MMIKLALCVITTFLIVGVKSQLKYCNMPECGTRMHIGCLNPTGAWNVTNCPPLIADRTLVNLTAADRAQFLHIHNKWRNHIATGSHPRFKKAARMAQLTWDTELENLCKLNVKRCKMEHDRCIATKTFPGAGQNLYAYSNSGGYKPTNQTILDAIEKGWYSESQYANQTDLDKCCSSSSGHTIGHFTEMIIDKQYKVGCAISKFGSKDTWKNVIVCCNYSFVNMGNQPIYVKAVNKTGEGCKAMSPSYKGLCNVGEYP